MYVFVVKFFSKLSLKKKKNMKEKEKSNHSLNATKYHEKS